MISVASVAVFVTKIHGGGRTAGHLIGFAVRNLVSTPLVSSSFIITLEKSIKRVHDSSTSEYSPSSEFAFVCSVIHIAFTEFFQYR